MSFFNACSSIRASTSKLFSRAGPSALPAQAQVARSSSSYVNLGDLKPSKGSNQTNTRYGRGIGSGRGGTSGRGHKGQRARSGNGKPTPGFEGGQTPIHRLFPKRGFINFTARDFAPLPLSRLQSFLAQARISPSEPITLHTLISSNIVHGLSNKFSGIKLLGEADPALPLPPLKLFLSRYSKSAAKAVLDAGGEVTAVYRNKLGLRAEKLGAVDEIKMADPTRKNDIEYYTNPKKYGYLAQRPAPAMSEATA